MAQRSRTRNLDSSQIVTIALVLILVTVVTALVTIALAPKGPAVMSESQFTHAPEAAEPPRIAFMGDSWASGAGAEPSGKENSYAGIVVEALGWPNLIVPGSGTGYTRGTATAGPYLDRVAEVLTFDPDVVVIQGSSNDYQASGEQIQAAASEVYATIRAALPNAQIFAVGVVNSPSAPADRMDISRVAVSAASAANGATWIDANAEGWLDIDVDFLDGYHPNNVGHQKVADHLVPILTVWNDAREVADSAP